jgi:chromosome segregation ATPase
VSRASSPRFEGGTPSTLKILHMEELREKARQIERELEELGDENPERAERLHAELREIHEAIALIERDVSMSRGQGAIREMRQRELQEHAHELESRLQELGDNHPEEAQELRMQLEQIHQQMERIERVPDILGPLHRVEEPMQPGELHRAELMIRREQLHAQLRDLELVLRELNQQGKVESEEAHEHRMRMDVLQQQLREIENEFRSSEPGRARERGREDLEREVQNLRKQMDGMNEQMSEMRELMKRLLEKKESPEAG